MDLTQIFGWPVPSGGLGLAAWFFALAIGHMIADYPLQGQFLATAKNRHHDAANLLGDAPAPKGLWIHALSAHACIHAGLVWCITGSLFLGLLEFVLHWVIDFTRCEAKISFNLDQLLHLLCKAIYVALMATGMTFF